MLQKIYLIFFAGITLGIGNLKADFITSNSQGSDTVNFPNANLFNSTTVALTSVQGQSLTLTASTPFAIVGNSGLDLGYGFGPNGEWFLPMAGVDTSSDSITFDFNGFSVSSIGGIANYDPIDGAPPLIEALDASNNVIESYNLALQDPINTPGGTNAGVFVGISRSQGDIAGFRITGAGIALQQLSFQAIPAPEPTIWGLLVTGLILLPFTIRKQKA
jgi:hypothetical protein